ncbi:hypothetical protein [Rhizobium sp. GN54]|uniref:hypothetical protein n=1 Tax=Rhizobium sp. GN54 TaxID=2898150 RepID=UPI001E5A36EA|nr:hypothetical protein [Rhizobium sp. GN54]MCD2185391.1 hypothetical protein [Rhizobium sp. GN54]
MAYQTDGVAGEELGQIKIILNTLYLCIGYAIYHIAAHEGTESAEKFKSSMLSSLENGDIDMALLEEPKTFDLVISKIQALTVPVVDRGADES